MSAKKKILIGVVVLVLIGIVVGTILNSQANVTKVATGKVAREDLVSIVSGTGQIKPKTYVNIGATAFGRITHLNVKEGDHVKAGTVLATLENVQPEATVAAQKATIASSRTDVTSYVAAEKTADANVAQARADLEQKQLDYNRALALFNDKLIAKQDFDAKKAAFDVSAATLQQRQASFAQAKAQTASQRGHVLQNIATQRSNYDALDKTVSRAPFDGLVTNVPVREGETMVTGIQNAEGSTLMTLADMSVITAEVKVDETDIVNVQLNQPVDVTVDALPGRTFKGHVTQVGDQALLRTTGVATSQSTTGTEEAKDFKVVVTLDNPSDELRPGLSTTAKITTSHKPNALTIPIQALVQRDLETEKAFAANDGKQPTTVTDSSTTNRSKAQPTQGVYLLETKNNKLRAMFIPVTTGITGATDIEVLTGLKQGDEIVTGRYKVLRTLNSGTRVKVDNTSELATSASTSN
ncbi:efflux RND transporter periplasmic adaptor subunit [Granulicella arctica]|uniref:HlyD family secretion protein n=1 Tax=Granulicella arctica TaxID=940613 RepID=A0A7Y9PI90_9BACT|nr:efflux RND transporter periplasmic adaptor subunit [Granulicella arctica]NYF80312.1 HlyD family secretion protein [Granulicella arctica]